MTDISWERYPLVSLSSNAKEWLQSNDELSPNTIDAYGRSLEDFLTFCSRNGFDLEKATRGHIALWFKDLSNRPNPNRINILIPGSGIGLSDATKSQRLSAVRLFYDYLCEEGIRTNNPVGRALYAPRRHFRNKSQRGFFTKHTLLPWMPTEDEWLRLLQEVRKESLRNRFMFVLQYECALRREELCLLHEENFDPAQRLLHIPAGITKSRRPRVVGYCESAARLHSSYLAHRRMNGQAGGPMFLSESKRNYAAPITFWTWSKAVRSIALRSRVPKYSTHTARHLRITDFARMGVDERTLAEFAGHRWIETTRLYINMSGRNLEMRFAKAMLELNKWRGAQLKGLVYE